MIFQDHSIFKPIYYSTREVFRLAIIDLFTLNLEYCVRLKRFLKEKAIKLKKHLKNENFCIHHKMKII